MLFLLKIGVPYRYDDEQILSFLQSKGFRLGQRSAGKFSIKCLSPKCVIYLVNSSVLPELVEEGVLDAALIPSGNYRETKSFAVQLLDLNLIVGRLMLGVSSRLAPIPLRDLPIEGVLTRTPVLTQDFLEKNHLPWKMRVVRGTTESLLPVFGKKYGIVEYVRTGSTMEANGITPVATIATSSVLLIASHDKAHSKEMLKLKKMLAAKRKRA